MVLFQEQPVTVPVVQKPYMPMEIDNEDSLDAPPSVGSADTPLTTLSQRNVKNQSLIDIYEVLFE